MMTPTNGNSAHITVMTDLGPFAVQAEWDETRSTEITAYVVWPPPGTAQTLKANVLFKPDDPLLIKGIYDVETDSWDHAGASRIVDLFLERVEEKRKLASPERRMNRDA